MNVQDFTGDPNAVLDTAFSVAKLNPKKNPTLEIAMRAVGDTVKKAAIAKLTDEINTDLMDSVAMYEINNGEYVDVPEEGNARDDYESGMDDDVEKSLEDWEPYLSADWLGKNTIDTKVWESTDDDRTIVLSLAESAAKEVYKNITADKTPAQVLSSAGIVKADVEARLAANTGDAPMTDASTDFTSVVERIKTYLGNDFEHMAVYEDVETVMEEEDEILVGSGAQRLGITREDVETLLMASLDMDDPTTEVFEAVKDFKPASARSKKAAAKKASAAAKQDAEANGLPTSVFVALKECGAGDTAMAEAIGVSRSTYTNYLKGKTSLEPNAEQHALLRGDLVERANKLLAALSELDGTELTQVA